MNCQGLTEQKKGMNNMSDKRAVLRRELKLREKMHKKAQHGDMQAIANELFMKGHDQGLTVAYAIIFMALNEMYGFSYMKNGKGKLNKLIEKIRDESAKMSQEPTRFNCEYYIRVLKEQTGLEFTEAGAGYGIDE